MTPINFERFAGLILLLACSACACRKEGALFLPGQAITLGVPLGSEEGSIKLAALKYVAGEVLSNTHLLFLPLSDEEISRVRSCFGHREIRSAVRAYPSKEQGIRDRVTKEPGVLLIVGPVKMVGNEAEIGAGYVQGTSVTFKLRLCRETGEWKVREAGDELIAD